MLEWWPIKAYRPCPNFVERGGKYVRSGQGACRLGTKLFVCTENVNCNHLFLFMPQDWMRLHLEGFKMTKSVNWIL